MKRFILFFNHPTRFFETLGYLTVIIGIITVIFGIVQAAVSFIVLLFNKYTITTHSPGMWLGVVIMGLIFAIFCSQPFFAIAKVLRAADKYLEERDA